MKIVLTGCNGVLGRVCGAHLVDHGHAVMGVDAQAAGDRPHPVLVADLRDPAAIHRAMDSAADEIGGRVDAIVHLANHTRADVAPSETVLRENLAINTSVFTAAVERGVGRVVFSSSVQSTLGGVELEFKGDGPTAPARLPIDETIDPRPTNAYGLSKLLSERMLEELCRIHADSGMTAVSLRLPFVMSQRGYEFNTQRRAPSEHLWGATEAFMYVHVGDAAEAIRLACEADGIDGAEVMWITAPDPRPPDDISVLAEGPLRGVAGLDACVGAGSFVDTSRAERVLGWRASRVLREARAGLASS